MSVTVDFVSLIDDGTLDTHFQAKCPDCSELFDLVFSCGDIARDADGGIEWWEWGYIFNCLVDLIEEHRFETHVWNIPED